MRTRWFFGLFLVSGFCSLLYEVVWLRLAMAEFGVTTPMVSIVLSIFMAGLALGSLGAGLLPQRFGGHSGVMAIRLYAVAELVIAASGEVVPRCLAMGRAILVTKGDGAAWGSSTYYLASGAWIALALLPFCLCMGATLPLAMWAIRQLAPHESQRSFSYLYTANLVGAAAGALLSAFVMIEIFGFRGTLTVAVSLNALLAASALGLSLLPAGAPAPATSTQQPAAVPSNDGVSDRRILLALFATGLASMAMEVVWVRQFTPYLGNVVYTFASILAVYLVATFVGSSAYRRWAQTHEHPREGILSASAWSAIGFLGMLPLVTADDRIGAAPGVVSGLLRVCFGLGPFCAALGFATPLLVDRRSGGDPRRASGAYALNVLGSLAGPLLSGFVLLPLVGERWATLALALPLLLFGLLAVRGSAFRGWVPVAAAGFLSILVLLSTRAFESRFPIAVVRRDSTATVTATGQGMGRLLLVNGIGMTNLTPSTKLMAHLPLVSQQAPPASALTICFGMGTSFRSILSWGIHATAVELVPSVPSLFGFFHEDGAALLKRRNARIVIDDGRRFLDRSGETYDAIVIDPPPPIEAAGSSLLYSHEFYESAKKRLRPWGVLQQWTPVGETRIIASFARTLRESFPQVRAFLSIEGLGIHYLCSARAIPRESAAILASRMPEAAARDLVEWGPGTSAEEQLRAVIEREVSIDAIVANAPDAPVLHDDRPINEYYFLRRTFGH